MRSAEPIETTHVWSVADAMRRDIVTVDRSTDIATALDVALVSGHDHVVVVDDRDVLLDLVPVHLLSTALLTRIVAPWQPVGDALAADPLRMGTDADLAEAVEVMLSAGSDAVGVVDPDGRLMGVVTWTDIGRLAIGT